MNQTLVALALISLVSACTRSDACVDCAIGTERIAVLGDEDGEGALEGLPVVSARVRGAVLVLQPDGIRGVPRLFQEGGSFERTIGRDGEGPGEFRSPHRAYGFGDSLYVFDASLLRLTVLTADGVPRRESSWQYLPYDIIPLDDGSWIVAGSSRGSRLLAHLRRDGSLIEEFGDTASRESRRHHVARTKEGRFWSAPSFGRLRFQEWLAPGRPGRAVEVASQFFAPYEQYQRPTESSPPSPALRGFWVDSLSRIWAVVEFSGSNWRAGYGAPRLGEGGRTSLPLLDRNVAFSTAVVVVDALTGTVLAERSLDGWYYQVAEPGRIVRAVRNDDGWHRAEIWRVWLREE